MTRSNDMIISGNLILDDDWTRFEDVEVGDLFCQENPTSNKVSFLYTKISKAQFKDITTGKVFRADKTTKGCWFFIVRFK